MQGVGKVVGGCLFFPHTIHNNWPPQITHLIDMSTSIFSRSVLLACHFPSLLFVRGKERSEEKWESLDEEMVVQRTRLYLRSNYPHVANRNRPDTSGTGQTAWHLTASGCG